MVARSILWGEGSQRSSPRRVALAAGRPTGRLYHRTLPVISPGEVPSHVAVEGSHQLQREAVGAVERSRVDPLSGVVRGVPAGDVALLVQAGDRRRPKGRHAG